jgi:hypothetical protein
LASLARGKLRNKVAELEQALGGRVRDHHRFLPAEYVDEWEALGQRIARIEADPRPPAGCTAKEDLLKLDYSISD